MHRRSSEALQGELITLDKRETSLARAILLGSRYGAFSVSHSDVARVASYIARQEEHHRKKTFNEEFELFVRKYGLEWHE